MKNNTTYNIKDNGTQLDINGYIRIQYQVNGAQLDISGYIRTKCVDGPVTN